MELGKVRSALESHNCKAAHDTELEHETSNLSLFLPTLSKMTLAIIFIYVRK